MIPGDRVLHGADQFFPAQVRQRRGCEDSQDYLLVKAAIAAIAA
jgi:hypothetical protein